MTFSRHGRYAAVVDDAVMGGPGKWGLKPVDARSGKTLWRRGLP